MPSPAAVMVLVVEDEALIRMLVAMEFEEAGYAVSEATNADEALSLLERTDVDLVVTDVRMPGAKTGLEVAAWLRAHRPRTKVIVMSGYVHEEVSTVATQFDAFIRKPFKPTEVLEQANALLTGSNEAS